VVALLAADALFFVKLTPVFLLLLLENPDNKLSIMLSFLGAEFLDALAFPLALPLALPLLVLDVFLLLGILLTAFTDLLEDDEALAADAFLFVLDPELFVAGLELLPLDLLFLLLLFKPVFLNRLSMLILLFSLILIVLIIELIIDIS
jgi:hypothetical protein